MSIDVVALKQQYPALRREVAGHPVIHADAPGGTQVPEMVIDAMTNYLRGSNANSGGAFVTSEETDALITGARKAAADLLGCSPDEVAFGWNMTTLNFALSRALARNLTTDDEIVVTMLDHDANISPWLAVAEDTGATVKWADIDDSDCTLDMRSLDAALSERTRIVAFTMASNAVGTIPRAKEITARAHATGALAIADAVHYAPHGPIDVKDIGVDALLCSPYKFYGPHLGIFYAPKEHLDRWRPYKVRPASDEAPDRWETGTMSHEALAGLTACVDHLASLGHGSDRRSRITSAMAETVQHEGGLSARFIDAVSRMAHVKLFGISDPGRLEERTPTFALTVAGKSPLEVAKRFGAEGVFVWDGNYYALAVMERLGLEDHGGAVRIGFCRYHSTDDVDRVTELLAAMG
ncbi:MAG: cysteine desulfurase-like protein [Actinobacteria bacterium]|nr:cysteine desulfurase-like protein [Actinomycetota bacterium]